MKMRDWIFVLLASLLLTACAIFLINQRFPNLPVVGTETAVVFAASFIFVSAIAWVVSRVARRNPDAK